MAQEVTIIPLFDNLTEKEIKEFLSFTNAVRYEKDHYLFRKGDQSKDLYIIFSGHVEISSGASDNDESIHFPVLGDGTIFGEIAFFDNNPRTASIKTLDHLEAIVLSQEDFFRFEEANPKLAIKVLKEFARIISERLRWSDEIIVELMKS